MNRPIRSILRHAAQGYALGHIDLAEYRSFRRKVLDAITRGEQPPTVPIHWLQAPESLIEVQRPGWIASLAKVMIFLVLLGGLGAGAVYRFKPDLWASTTRDVARLLEFQLEGPIGELQSLSYDLVGKDVWANTDISRAMKTWDQLSAEDKRRARDYLWFQDLMDNAERRVSELRELEKYSSDKASLRGQADAISMLAGALNSRR